MPLRKSFWAYDNIKLKLFIEIAQTKELHKLIVEGSAEIEELQEQWEEIIKLNANANNDFTLDQYSQSVKSYGILLRNHILIKIAITKLKFRVDEDDINFLKSHRIKIDQSTATSYNKTLEMAERKSDNLVTRMNMELTKVQNLIAEKMEEQGKGPNMEELLAQVSVGIGFQVMDDITLARYNEYKKVISRRVDNQKNRKVKQ